MNKHTPAPWSVYDNTAARLAADEELAKTLESIDALIQAWSLPTCLSPSPTSPTCGTPSPMTPADVDNLTTLAIALSKAMDTTDADLRTKLQPLADAIRPIMAEAYPDPLGGRDMIFTQKVNRLEYLTRMGFDNRADEKKELMLFFSKLERKQMAVEKLVKAAKASTDAIWNHACGDKHLADAYSDLEMALMALEDK